MFSISAHAYPEDFTAENPEGTEEILINGDAIRRDHLYHQLSYWKGQLMVAKSENSPQLASIQKTYKIVRKLYRRYKTMAVYTGRRISDLRSTNPALFAHLASIRNENGQAIRAFIGSFTPLTGHDYVGETLIVYRRSLYHPPTSFARREVIKGVEVLPQIDHAIVINVSVWEDLATLRHELGHFETAVVQSQAYMGFLHQHQHGPDHACHQFGHHPLDPSGQKAIHYEYAIR
ncbi:MAG: hypothetical protein AAFR61_29380 [Bacteroidota bacterium]